VREVQDGCAVAAERLIRHLQPLVGRLVRRHLPRREAEEDLAQDVFIKLFEKLHLYTAQSGIPFEHWASRLTVRTCLDALRREKARPEWRLADLTQGEADWWAFLADQATPTPDSSLGADAHALVERLLSELPPADRLVLTLLDLEERSTREISEITGWTRPGVKMRAMRARLRLKAIARIHYHSEFTDHE
jgi:RNA polymerase sigma-70 factor, ECF subfamily